MCFAVLSWSESIAAMWPPPESPMVPMRAASIDSDENTLLDLDNNGQICAITIEHASERAEIPKFSYEQITP